MEYASDNVNLINGKDNGDHEEGLQEFKALLKKIKEYGTGERTPKPKKILIATDADACLFRGYVSPCAGQMGMGVMSDMVYVYRNIFKLCEEAGIECDFCFLTKLQPCQCNLFFKKQLSKRLGKDKKGYPFIKPENIKFAPFDGENKENDHESFNKKMFDEEGYKDTEVLYFDNDLCYHKIKDFKTNLQSKTQEFDTVFPVNIIHTEDVKNWITEEDMEDIVKKKLGNDFDLLGQALQGQWSKIGGKVTFIERQKQYNPLIPQLEQKTHKGNFNKDGLKVDELLKATQDVLFDAKHELKGEQNEWIKQNFETDKELARKLFEKYSKKTNPLLDQTVDKMNKDGGGIFEVVFYEVAKDTFDEIKGDEEIESILKKYPQEPKLDTIVNKEEEEEMAGKEIFEDVFYGEAKDTFQKKNCFEEISNNPSIHEQYPNFETNAIKERMIVQKMPSGIGAYKERKIKHEQFWPGKNKDVIRLMDKYGNQIDTWIVDNNQEPQFFPIERGCYCEGDGIRVSNERKDANNRIPSITKMRINGKILTFICK